jgi:hypothetical protein
VGFFGEDYTYDTIKGKAIPVTGLVDNRITDDGEAVSLMHQLPFTPQKDSWYLFLLEVGSTPGPVQLEGSGQLKKFSDLIENKTHCFPACSIVPQPTTLPRAPYLKHNTNNNYDQISSNVIIRQLL